jgi:hypothetical protein
MDISNKLPCSYPLPCDEKNKVDGQRPLLAVNVRVKLTPNASAKFDGFEGSLLGMHGIIIETRRRSFLVKWFHQQITNIYEHTASEIWSLFRHQYDVEKEF